MSEKGDESCSHQQAKPSLKYSLLRRDRAKNEGKEDDESGVVASESASPTTSEPMSHHTLGHLRPSRHKAKPSMGTIGDGDSSDPWVDMSGPGRINAHITSAPTVQEDMTIEQSVRLFRLFEILRNGDVTAITKAVRDTSTVPTSEVGGISGYTGALDGARTTILHLAVQCAEPQVIEHILATAKSPSGVNIDVNTRDRDGNTPLHLASMMGRIATVRLLLEQSGANDSLVNYEGRTPLDLARTPEIFQQLQLFRSLFVDAKVREIQKLVSQGEYQGLERLLEDSRVEAVLDINGGELVTDPSTIQCGGTLLHEAARKKDMHLIQLLLMHGADPFRRDRKGKLPQDVTKDERTRAILKKSPAAAAAQRGVQEKAILGHPSSQSADNTPGGKEGREFKGYLKKWTNYTTGYKLRWFVLEDGVLSYYKHQDDAGYACRGAINMRIAKLYMDPQDKTRFEIQGKSSVKYHLKANHVVEAKRWFWALNNAIQWTKDEAREEEKRKGRDAEALRQAKLEQSGRQHQGSSGDGPKLNSKGFTPGTAVGVPLTASTSRVSFHGSNLGSVNDDGDASPYGSYDPSAAANDMARTVSRANTATLAGDLDDEDEYGDDASSRELKPASKDAFNITAQSATLQLNLLGQVCTALQAESSRSPARPISDPTVAQAISTYDSAVRSLQSLIGDLLKISKDRDAYWQHRLEQEADVRRLWEDSMAHLAKQQEELEDRIGESEDKRKRTKRALREALESTSANQSPSQSRSVTLNQSQISSALEGVPVSSEGIAPLGKRKMSIGIRERGRRRSTLAELTNLSDSDSDEDEEFFDAVDAGEVEVVAEMPKDVARSPPPMVTLEEPQMDVGKDKMSEDKTSEIATSFRGYEDPVRKRLKMDADDRPKISLWGILKSMIGKDMTKMTLPVSFNEPTSLLQRVAEDMEYTDLLDTAAERTDPTERMVYVAAFAASEYASTIGRVAKPFNPLLGETYEYARPDKGYRFFIEQVSHHPPIGAAWAESPKWDYYGESAVKSKFYGKSFDINPLGTWFLKLRPASGGEELYTWKKVTSSVVGIITGSPTVDNYGLMEIKNWTTGEVCTLDFKQRGWKASSAFQMTGKVLDANGRTRWSMGGRWNDKIYARLTPGFEGTVTPPPGQSRAYEPGSTQAFLVWEAHTRPTGIPFNLTPFGLTLNALPERLRPVLPPTDTRLRPDQRAMEDGEYDFAATEKNRVEEKQRAKRREREENGEEFVPRWFSKGRCEVTGEEYWVTNGEYWRVRDGLSRGGRWEGVEEIF